MPNYREIYGALNPRNTSVNDTMLTCLELLPESEAHKVAKRLKHQWEAGGNEAEHTYHELILGAFLAENGCAVVYELPLEGKTPDWTVVQADPTPRAIIEVSNHRLDFEQEQRMFAQHAQGEVGIAYPDNIARLYARFDQKAGAYAALLRGHALPYVVAVFGNFFAAVDHEEVRTAIFGDSKDRPSAFAERPVLAGAYFFQESGVNRSYVMTYIANPHALHPIELPSGRFVYGRGSNAEVVESRA